MDTIQEEITLHHHNNHNHGEGADGRGSGGDGGEQQKSAIKQLNQVRHELTTQKDEMERVFGETGRLEIHEERRLIELGEVRTLFYFCCSLYFSIQNESRSGDSSVLNAKFIQILAHLFLAHFP